MAIKFTSPCTTAPLCKGIINAVDCGIAHTVIDQITRHPPIKKIPTKSHFLAINCPPTALFIRKTADTVRVVITSSQIIANPSINIAYRRCQSLSRSFSLVLTHTTIPLFLSNGGIFVLSQKIVFCHEKIVTKKYFCNK